jgi:spore coat polysaccharide biosynthesis protein SpsF
MKDSRSILFRCDASPEIGMGHLVRCLALAEILRDDHGCRVTFAMRDHPLGLALAERHGCPVIAVAPENIADDYGEWLGKTAQRAGASALVLDVRDDLSLQSVRALQKQGILIVSLDDNHERRLASDLAFYPPVPQFNDLCWQGYGGECHSGWEWVLLRRQFRSPPPRFSHAVPRFLVTMGGSDPAGFTPDAVAALRNSSRDFLARVVTGPGFVRGTALDEMLATSDARFHVLADVADMAALMADSDLALASFGVTAYELAACGVPALFFCLSQDHALSATAFVAAGIALSFGFDNRPAVPAITAAVERLWDNRRQLAGMRDKALSLVDGRGGERIAGLIVRNLESRYAGN